MMKVAIATLTPRFSANRMVRDYVELGYLPAAWRSTVANGSVPAAETVEAAR